jgi:hypothetical protein
MGTNNEPPRFKDSFHFPVILSVLCMNYARSTVLRNNKMVIKYWSPGDVKVNFSLRWKLFWYFSAKFKVVKQLFALPATLHP